MEFNNIADNICKRTDINDFRKSQLVMTEMLLVIHNLCLENRINYWLDSGTLLGAIRHKGFIPWDDDIDICMPREDYEKFLEIDSQQFPVNLCLESEEVNLHSKLSWARLLYPKKFKWLSNEQNKECVGLSIDIFPVDLVPDDINSRKRTKILNKIALGVKPKKIRGLKDLTKKIVFSYGAVEAWKRYLKNIGNRDYYIYGVETPFLSQNCLYNKKIIYPLKEAVFENYNFLVPQNYHEYLTILYGNYMKIPKEGEREQHLSNIQVIKE